MNVNFKYHQGELNKDAKRKCGKIKLKKHKWCKEKKRIDIKRKIFIENFIDSVLKPVGSLLFPIVVTMLVALYLEYIGEPLRRMDAVILVMLLYLSIK